MARPWLFLVFCSEGKGILFKIQMNGNFCGYIQTRFGLQPSFRTWFVFFRFLGYFSSLISHTELELLYTVSKQIIIFCLHFFFLKLVLLILEFEHIHLSINLQNNF